MIVDLIVIAMASAMASLVTGATSSAELRTRRASQAAICGAGQRVPQLAYGVVCVLRSRGAGSLGERAGRLSWTVSQSGDVSVPRLSAGRVDAARATGSPVACVAGWSGGNGAAGVASAVVSRAVVVVSLVVRVAKALGDALTATPLPDGSTNAERELVKALKGRLVLAAGPLLFASISQAPGSVSTPLTVVASGMAKWLELYSGVLMVRVLLSWFPNIPWERQPLQAVRDMCDPYLNLFRNIIPPLFNALDLSPMLAFMVLGVLTSILNTTAR